VRRWAHAPMHSSGRWSHVLTMALPTYYGPTYLLWPYLLTMALRAYLLWPYLLTMAVLTIGYLLPTYHLLPTLPTAYSLPPTPYSLLPHYPAQLELAQQQTLAVEAKLREGNQLAAAAGRPKPPELRAPLRSPGPGSTLQPAGSALSARSSANPRRAPPLRPQSAQGAAAAAAAVSGRQSMGLGPMTALQGGGLGWGPTSIQPRAENPDMARGNRPPGSGMSVSAPRPRNNGGPPTLSIGFGAEGSAPVAAAPAAPQPRKTTPGPPMGRYGTTMMVPRTDSSLQVPQ
jgi:hypothetical protein